jgi:Spy/CpxP family protein refolding chaperone
MTIVIVQDMTFSSCDRSTLISMMSAINTLAMESRLIMKSKLMPMLIGAIALTLTAAPLVVHAQSQSDDYETPTYGQGQYQGRGRFAGINLSQNQKDQMARIRQDSQDRIQRILTPAQRQQLQSLRQNRRQQGTARAQGQRGRGMFSSLNLSDDQRRQLRDVMKDSKSRMEAVLTQQQRDQMQRNIQNMRARRQQSNGQSNQ